MPYTTDSDTGLQVWSGESVRASSRPALRRTVDAHEVRIDDIEQELAVEVSLGDLDIRVDALEAADDDHDDRLDEIEVTTDVRKDEITLAVAAQIDDRIFGLTGTAAEKSLFSTMDHATPSYIRSKDCWIRDVDLTCASPWNSGNAHKWAGTAITPYHIAMANHAYVATNSTIRFITMDNTVVTRTVSGSVQVGSTDLRIGVLDSALPASITPAKLLPDDYATWMDFDGLPMACFDQEEKALVYETELIAANQIDYIQPAGTTRALFYEALIDGDSGNPAFFIINGEAVLIAAQNPALHLSKAGITTAIATLAATVAASAGATWDEVTLYSSVSKANVRGLSAAPFILPTYTVATLPSAARYKQGLIYVSDGTSNKRLAVSDGTNWRWPDGAIVS